MRKQSIRKDTAAKILGRLGGAATKGISTPAKQESGRINAAKARAALAAKRLATKTGIQLYENKPNIVLDSGV